jgi:hypothetical protein
MSLPQLYSTIQICQIHLLNLKHVFLSSNVRVFNGFLCGC